VQTGPNKGTLAWLPLRHHRALQILHNPRYAGAFTYGRRRQRRTPDGRMRHTVQPRESWTALIPDAHPGYISWHTYEDNQRILAAAAQARGQDRRASPPREGPALLQGLAICARCGNRMTVRYHTRGQVTFPEYVCGRKGIEQATPACQSVPGEGLDAAIGQLLLDTVTPLALEVALTVQAELEARAVDADQLRRRQVERARHAAEQARRRYLAVDPDNRLVAANLEADWNDALRALTAAQEDYERRSANATPLSERDKERIAALAADFPALWNDKRTPQRERKRMVRLLITDVTLHRGEQITAHVRFTGSQHTTLTLPLPLPAPDLKRTPAEVIGEVDRLLDQHTDAGVADALNAAGVLSGTGQPFHAGMICHIRKRHGLKSRPQRLRERGLLPLDEAAAAMNVCTHTVKRWHRDGLLHGEPSNDKGSHHYLVPAVTPFRKTGRPPKDRQAKETHPADTPGGAV
jgi:hypothetical protein